MLASSVPVKFQQPFANNAGPSYTRAIPNTTVDTTAASLNLGFPPACFVDVALGGTPPNGMDFNGILNEITANTQWWQAGGFAAYDSVFSTAIGGYPNGAILQMATGKGFWKSTVDNNTSDPDTSGANWSVAAIAPGAYLDLSVAGGVDVTLTSVQSANRVIDLFGTLTANINVIVPTATGNWIFNNGTTGAFTITVKTAAGTGVIITQGTAIELWSDGVNVYLGNSGYLTQSAADIRYSSSMFSVSASVASNAMTVGLNPCKIDFRNATLGTGTPSNLSVGTALSLVIPSGATLGTINAVQSRIMLLAINNAGTVELAVVNEAGGVNLDETGLISTTAISAAATSATTIYSTNARTNVPYRVVGYAESTQAAAGTWATNPSLVQGIGGQAGAAMQSYGFGQTPQDVTASRAAGTTYYNTTGKPIFVSAVLTGSANTAPTMTVNGVVYEGSYEQAANQMEIGRPIPVGGSYSFGVLGGTVASLIKVVEMR